MTDPLNPIRWKLWRSRQLHQQAIEVEAAHLESPNLCSFVQEQDRKGRLVYRVSEVSPTPALISLLVGDMANNLRTALDHLMFLLARPATEKEERAVAFPIVKSSKDFAGTRRNMPGVPKGVRTLVETLQPYHRRKWPETALLGQLQAINNWDKHRQLATAVASLEDSYMNLRAFGTTVTKEVHFRGKVKPGTAVARFELGHSQRGAVILIEPRLGYLLVFDDSMPSPIRRATVIATMADIGNFIEHDLLPRFDRFLDK